jgi:excisionase family DNA binding protein
VQRALGAGKLTREMSSIARRLDQGEREASMHPAEAVSVGKAASQLGVSPATVRNWVEKGYLHAFRLPSGVRRIPRSELDRLIQDYFTFAPAHLGGDEATMSMANASEDGVWPSGRVGDPSPASSDLPSTALADRAAEASR